MTHASKLRNHARTLPTGITLLELLFVLCIVSIIASMATPSLSAMVSKQHNQADADKVVDAVHLARLTAVHERRITTLCAGRPDTGCTARWQDGLLIIADHPGNPYRPETLLYALETNPASQWHGNIARLMFNETGTLEGQSGSLIVCSKGPTARQALRIVINRGGRVRIERQRSAAAAEQLCNQSWRY